MTSRPTDDADGEAPDCDVGEEGGEESGDGEKKDMDVDEDGAEPEE